MYEGLVAAEVGGWVGVAWYGEEAGRLGEVQGLRHWAVGGWRGLCLESFLLESFIECISTPCESCNH